MSSATQLLTELAAFDIKLSVTDGKLRCNAPKGAITADLRDQIKQLKPDLVDLLTQQAPSLPHKQHNKLGTIDRAGALPCLLYTSPSPRDS